MSGALALGFYSALGPGYSADEIDILKMDYARWELPRLSMVPVAQLRVQGQLQALQKEGLECMGAWV